MGGSLRKFTTEVAALCAFASLAAANGLPEPLLQCASEKDDTARLTCYDREIARVTAVAPPPVQTAEENFGVQGELLRKRQEREEATRPPQIETLESRIVKLSERPLGHGVFELENGQVWEQKELSGNFLVRAGDKVKISAGVLGAFWLSNESGRRTRVKRIR